MNEDKKNIKFSNLLNDSNNKDDITNIKNTNSNFTFNKLFEDMTENNKESLQPKTSKELDKNISTQKKEPVPDTNIFTPETKEESDSKEEEQEKLQNISTQKKEPTPDTNIFTPETKEESDSKEEKQEKLQNIFTQKEEPTPDTNIFTPETKEESDSKEEEQEKLQNIFTKKEEPTPDTNIFTTEESNEQNTNTNQVNSPFFEDSIPENNNDIFIEQKINLNEHNKFNNNNKIDLSNTKHYNVKIIKKKEPLPKFIIGVLSYALFIWLLLIGLALLVYVADIKIRALKGDYSAPKYNAYVVLSGSMLPEIKVYDVVVTKKIAPKDLKMDDVITFASSDSRFEGTIITHRIINTYHDANTGAYTFQTKGDNNNVADSALVQSSNIYGKVILKIPKLGYLQRFLAQQGGWIIVILIPCLLVISFDIVKLIKSIKGKKYRRITITK